MRYVRSTIPATDGTPVTIVHPSLDSLPSEEHANKLVEFYQQNVRALDPKMGWKGPCETVVEPSLANLAMEAMEFMGSIVDTVDRLPEGKVRLFSEGYYAHGF